MHPLIEAAGRGDIAEIDKLLDEGVPPGVAQGVWTPLQTAIARRQAAAALHLLSRGADPNQSNAGHQTPLWRASAVGLVEVVHALIEAKADVNAQDMDEGHTPLIAASVRGHIEVARALLDAGADLAKMTQSGVTALEVAHRSLAARSDPTAKARAEATIALLDGAISHRLGVIHESDASREVALRLAASTGRLNAAQRLLEEGARPDAPDSWNTGPLGLAAAQGHADVAALLLEAGADPHRRSMRRIYFERTPLFDAIGWAAARDRGAVIAAFAAVEVDLDRPDGQRWTPLMIAAVHGAAKAVEALLAAGVDPARQNGRRKTALALAKEAGKGGVAALLEGA